MTAVFITVLNMSITASVVALAVMLARIPLRKAPRIFSYALWGVVLFRLMFPFSIESIFSLMPTSANAVLRNIVVAEAPAINTGMPFIDIPINTAINNFLPPVAVENSVNPIYVILHIAGYIWLIGFIALLIYAAVGYVRLKRRVYFATLVRDNIFETDKIKSPFVLGFIRPKIYFPVGIDPKQYDYIVKHEQTHIKRRDYLIKPFGYVFVAMHWFNPIIWLSYFFMSKDMEMSCDEAVLRKTSEDIRGEYGATLLNLATNKVSLLNPIAFSFGENNIKERVVNVLSFKKPAKWVMIVSLLVVSIFFVGFTSDRIVAMPTVTPPPQFIPPVLGVYEVFSRNTPDRRPANAITPEEAADIAARYIWDNFGVSIDGSVVRMMFQYVQVPFMRPFAAEITSVPGWGFLIGERGVLTGVNMEYTFWGAIHAVTGEVIGIFPSSVEGETRTPVPFSGSSTQPNPYFEGRQVQLVELQIMTNHDDVLAFSYNPQTRVMWITNTRERVNVPPNHVNIRCAETDEIFHVQIVGTNNNIPVVAFVVKTTESGSPRLLALDNNGRPLDDGNIVIGLSPLDTPPPAPPSRPGYNVVQHGGVLTANEIAALTVPTPVDGLTDPVWRFQVVNLQEINDFDLTVMYLRWATLFEAEFNRPDITQMIREEMLYRGLIVSNMNT